ncbi:MAG: alpha/beta fold hydrolase [Gemmatimonadetes bacterium]|nr:alpha/beta fold hydrolase [Gemmatimonadota bacterium]
MRGEFLDLAGSRLYYYAAGTRGAGEPVLFLHGFPTSSFLWNDVTGLMPEGYRLIVLDLLGYGRSDRPGGASVSVSAHARRALDVLDTLNVPQACVVGHDLGGAVAQWMAVHAPERVTRLALVSSVGLTGWPRLRTRVARSLGAVARQLPAPLLAGEAYASLLRGFADPAEGRHSLDHFLRPFAQPTGRAALIAHLAAQSADETATLAVDAIRAPTAIVHGARDPFVPASLSQRLQRAIPGATLELLDSGSHFLPLDMPERVASAIGRLLAR